MSQISLTKINANSICPECGEREYTSTRPTGQMLLPTVYLCGSRDNNEANGIIQSPACRVISVLKEKRTQDEYHTMDELYTHRNMLFLALTRILPGAWYSNIHHDRTQYAGWFIAGIPTQHGMITYHCPNSLLPLAGGEMLECAPEWDGHTPDDVLNRLESIRGLDECKF